MNEKPLNIKIPIELYDKLKAEAERTGNSLAAVVRSICTKYFDEK